MGRDLGQGLGMVVGKDRELILLLSTILVLFLSEREEVWAMLTSCWTLLQGSVEVHLASFGSLVRARQRWNVQHPVSPSHHLFLYMKLKLISWPLSLSQ